MGQEREIKRECEKKALQASTSPPRVAALKPPVRQQAIRSRASSQYSSGKFDRPGRDVGHAASTETEDEANVTESTVDAPGGPSDP